MGSIRKNSFVRFALVCLAAAWILAQPAIQAERCEVPAPRTRLASALARTPGAAAGTPVQRVEALLPEMIEIASAPARTSGARRLRIKFTPKLLESARLELSSNDPALASALARQAPAAARLRLGDAPLERDVEWTPSADAKDSSLRVGLVFLDEAGRVTMTAHREFALASAPNEKSPKPSPASSIVRDSRSAAAETYRAEAPAPRIRARGGR